MAIKINTLEVINNTRGLTNIIGANGIYNSFHSSPFVVTTNLSFSNSVQTCVLTSNVSFSISGATEGRTSCLLLDRSTNYHTPSFPSSVTWEAGVEPTWATYQHWQVTLLTGDGFQYGSAVGFTPVSGGAPTESITLGGSGASPLNMFGMGNNGLFVGGWRFKADGNVYTYTQSNGETLYSSTTWNNISPSATNYVRFSNYSGSSISTSDSDTLSVWHALSSTRSCVWRATNASSSVNDSGVAKVEISTTSNGSNIVATGYYETEWLGDAGTGGASNTCLTNDMLVQVQGRTGLTRVYDLVVGDMISDNTMEMFTAVTHILKDHPREGYYTVDGWLEITHDHPMLIDNNWVLPNDYAGDKQYHEQDTDTVYIETGTGTFLVFNEDGSEQIIVHGDYANREDL